MSELFPAKTIGVELFSCTNQAREYQFNRWYNEINIPALKQTPGIISVHRYWNMKPELREKQAGYLTIYRIDSADPFTLMQKVTQEDIKKRAEQAGLAECMKSYQVSVWEFIGYRKSISPAQRPETRLADGMPDALLAVFSICTDPAREDEFNQWYLFTHFHDLLKTPGIVQAERYRSLNPKPAKGEPAHLALYEIDSDDPMAVQRRIPDDDKNLRNPQGRIIDCIRLLFGSGTYQHIDI